MTGEGSLFDVPPAAIGRYRVQHPLGAGTAGPVFRGESPDGLTVALKLITLPIRPERVEDVLDGLRRVVVDGAGIAGAVEPLDAGLHEGAAPFLVTALAPGDSLDVALRRFGPALLTDVLPRLSLLAGALDRLASRDLHHGALHPRDIVVDEASTLMTGAGLWPALAAGGIRLPRRGPYRAPEQADLALHAADDQFALAAAAYEWVTGRRAPAAFVAGDMAASVGSRREALGHIFARAMHLDPGQRFSSCQAFVDDLSSVDGGHAGTGAAAAPDERPRRRTRAAPEPLPLLTLEVTAPPEPDLPLLSALVVSPPAPALAQVSPTTHSPDESRRPLVSARAVAEDTVVFGAAGVAAWEVGDQHLHPDVSSIVHAGSGGDVRAPDIPPVRTSVSAQGPPLSFLSGAGLARAKLLAFGVAIGLSIGYAVWGRKGDNPAGPLEATTAESQRVPTREGPAAQPSTAPAGAPLGTSAAGLPTPAPDALPSPAAMSEDARATRTASVPVATGAARSSASAGFPSTQSSAPAGSAEGRRRAGSAATGPRVTAASRGAVRATSTPPGAMVMLDGKLVGKSPMTVRNVPPGAHTIEFRRQGHRPVTRPAQVKAGATTRVSATLPRAQEPR